MPPAGYIGGPKPIGYWDSEAVVFIFQQAAWKDMRWPQAMHLLACDYEVFHYHLHRLLKSHKITWQKPVKPKTVREQAEEDGHGFDSPNSFL